MSWPKTNAIFLSRNHPNLFAAAVRLVPKYCDGFLPAAAAALGYVRDPNEASYLVRDGLFLVADGMGGHDGGELASAAVVDTFRQAWQEHTEPMELDELKAWLTQANREVYDI